MYFDYLNVLVFASVGLVFVFANMIVGSVIRPKRKTEQGLEVYGSRVRIPSPAPRVYKGANASPADGRAFNFPKLAFRQVPLEGRRGRVEASREHGHPMLIAA